MSALITTSKEAPLSRLAPRPSKTTGEIRIPISAQRTADAIDAGQLTVQVQIRGIWTQARLTGAEDRKIVLTLLEGPYSGQTARAWADTVYDAARDKNNNLTRRWQKGLGLLLANLAGLLDPELDPAQ